MTRWTFKKENFTEKISILIPTMFDSRFMIELCLRSIKKYTVYPHYKIIVCDAGVDNLTLNYLIETERKKEIKLIKATDWQRPKDDLVRVVDTEYYLLMHDDIQILKPNWLAKRMLLMKKNEKNAIVGTIVKNYKNTKRFFPLGLLVKTDVSRKLDLKWGKQPDKGFDTGALAYLKFFAQNEFKFESYSFKRDIRHFSEMTWPKYHTEKDFPQLQSKLNERERKIQLIREILIKKTY